jgi:hypothetical protein
MRRMTRKPNPQPDDPAQSKRFIEAARAAETNESPKEFERVFQRVVGKSIPRKKPNRN